MSLPPVPDLDPHAPPSTAPNHQDQQKSHNAERFFRYVWRVNGLLLFGLATFGLLGLLVAILPEIWSVRPNNVAPAATDTPSTAPQEKLELGGFSPSNAEYLYAPLNADTSRYSSYDKGSSSIRNYFFYSTRTGRSHWLRPNHSGIILGVVRPPVGMPFDLNNTYGALAEDSLGVAPNDAAKKTSYAPYMLTLVVSADTNQDKVLSRRDKKTLELASLAGQERRVLLGGMDELKTAWLSADSKLSVLYLNNGKLNRATIDLSQPQSRAQISEVSLALPTTGTQP